MSSYVVTVTRDRDRADPLRQELLGPKRNKVLSLEEVVEAGRIFFKDPQALGLYGMPPDEWYARGVRILGRTCVEATPDVTAAPIARTVAETIEGPAGVIDPFAGSGNLMLHIAWALDAPARGMEADPKVHSRTTANLALIGAERVEVRHADWESYFDSQLDVPTSVHVLSPPWGEAFTFAGGLDLARTSPPVPHIIEVIAARDTAPSCYAVIQHTPVEPVRNVPPLPVAGRGDGCVILKIR